MGTDFERLSRWWKWIAFTALVVAVCSLAALATIAALRTRTPILTDERLIGTWQSDADRTINGIREARPVTDRQEASLRTLFGQMRVTYSPTTYTTELDGWTDSNQYKVIGKDEHSVVIRGVDPSPLAKATELSEFTVVQFDGPDSYWLYTQFGGIREYFKRIP